MKEDIRLQISALYEFALNNPRNEYQVIDMFMIDTALSQKILEKTGIDVDGFWVSIDNYSIVHTLFRHGNPAKEALHGQVAVTKADFLAIPDIILSMDNIVLDVKKQGKSMIKETLIFTKETDNCHYVLKEIRRVTKKGKINRLILQTMYIRRKT
ncbi:MAG: hypothetical protein IT269_10525 [Saprospiraceae bacterium]|nr:hypothetical protein [Saprospiraceae bacterium]